MPPRFHTEAAHALDDTGRTRLPFSGARQGTHSALILIDDKVPPLTAIRATRGGWPWLENV